MIKRALLALLAIAAIPLAGYLVATAILNDVDLKLDLGMGIEDLCGPLTTPDTQNFASNTKIQAACDEVGAIVLLRDASLWAGIVSFGLMILYGAAALMAGTSRALNAALFPNLIPLSQIAIAAIVLVQGAILTFGIYHGESYAFGMANEVLIAVIGAGALVASFALLRATFSLNRSKFLSVIGKQISRSEEPKIWELIDWIARKLGSRPPDNLIVGLEPKFYATAASIHLANEDKKLKGETIYLSLPLMRLFDVEELCAVIGHELSHFCGSDTAYSLKFAPAYARLSRSINTLANEEQGISRIVKLPVLAILSLMFELFSRNQRRISQERELLADEAGVSVSSTEALSVALGKVAVYAPIWSMVQHDNINRLNAGKISDNLSRVYEDIARYDVSHTGIAEVMEAILSTKIAHPTDTHPTISRRFASIGYDENWLTIGKLVAVGNSSRRMLGRVNEFEQSLTLYEHQLMVALGFVALPDGEGDKERDHDDLLNAVYTLAATMVAADGMIDPAEVVTAEDVGKSLFSDFDSIEFRACCNQLENLPAFIDTVVTLNTPLTYEHKLWIYEYLRDIAMADGEVAPEEDELLAHVRREWSL